MKTKWIVRDVYGWALSFSGREPSQVEDKDAEQFGTVADAENAVAGAPGRPADYSIEMAGLVRNQYVIMSDKMSGQFITRVEPNGTMHGDNDPRNAATYTKSEAAQFVRSWGDGYTTIELNQAIKDFAK